MVKDYQDSEWNPLLEGTFLTPCRKREGGGGVYEDAIAFNSLQCNRLTSEKEKERKKNRDVVAEADLRIELDWRQRSRQLWLSAGDANTRFFHMAASARRQQNWIRHILVGDRALTDQSSIGLALADYFREFYCRGPPNMWRWLANGAATLSPGQQQELILPVTEEEVLVAIRGLNSEGAPRPGLLRRSRIRGAGNDRGVLGRPMQYGSTESSIILLPKVEGAERIGDFRPISLSNPIYLNIAKVLANRFHTVLSALISPFQLALMPGRHRASGGDCRFLAAGRHAGVLVEGGFLQGI